jgi:hypothetical protein
VKKALMRGDEGKGIGGLPPLEAICLSPFLEFILILVVKSRMNSILLKIICVVQE